MTFPKIGTLVRIAPSDAAAPVAYPGGNRMFVAPDGDEVTWSDYWLRRLRDGSIYVVQPAPVSPPAGDPAPTAPSQATE